MIRITDNSSVRTCRGATRREFLRIGSLALGGLSLSSALKATEAGRSFIKDKAVVLLFLQGGPTQIETFDPKPSAPVEIRSITGAIQTKLPGVQFGGTFPKLAAMADKLAIVRSFASGNADHQDYMTVAGGGIRRRAPMGSLYARIAGPNAVPIGMPNNVILPAEAVQPGLRLPSNFETDSLRKLVSASQNLGANYAFFDPSGGGELRQNLELRLPAQRLTDRRGLLDRLDTFRRQADRTGVFENASAYDQQAYDLLLRGVSHAFDLSREDPRVVGRYDTSGLFNMTEVRRWATCTDVEPARQADAPRPSTRRAWLRLRHGDGRRLGHARQREQPAESVWPQLARQPGRPRRLDVPRRRRGARAQRQDSAHRHRRDGPIAAPEQQRRPGSLGQPDPAAHRRRRAQDGASRRPVRSPGRQSGRRTLHAAATYLDALDAKINALLPPRYQGCFDDVPAQSMGTASLKYDERGQVAWNEIWTSFCHLALAGGPPHRGTLMQPVSADETAADASAQKKVLAELDRGIRLTTWLATARSATPGWIGIRCYDEDMSGWLQRAIVAENVSARRERNVLYLPAGPGFRIEKEIKNVITCVAKTCHYLLDHVTPGARPAGLGRSLIEPPTFAELTADPDRHRLAAETIAQSIAETTGLPTRLSTPGWVDFDCGDEDMAVWLLRAIVVADVLVRRETAFVCVPAKPEAVKAVAEAHRLWRLKMASQAMVVSPTRKRGSGDCC